MTHGTSPVGHNEDQYPTRATPAIASNTRPSTSTRSMYECSYYLPSAHSTVWDPMQRHGYPDSPSTHDSHRHPSYHPSFVMSPNPPIIHSRLLPPQPVSSHRATRLTPESARYPPVSSHAQQRTLITSARAWFSLTPPTRRTFRSSRVPSYRPTNSDPNKATYLPYNPLGSIEFSRTCLVSQLALGLSQLSTCYSLSF